MKLFLKILAAFFVLLIVALFIWFGSNMKDRHRGYTADVTVRAMGKHPLRAGFAALPITPDVPDRWNDLDHNARYEPGKGDTFTDGNGNGVFDPVWIAGFGNGRAANGVHDDLWARTMVIDDGSARVAIVVLDAIGFMNDEIIEVRKRIPESAGITYTVVASTHTHEAPDLLGLWGRTPFRSGIDSKYMEHVIDQAANSVAEAASNLQPALLEISGDMKSGVPLVKDTREPVALDAGLRIIRAVNMKTGNTIGTLLSWADHAETLWSENLLITSDFPHYFREYVENGIYRNDTLIIPGTGGTAVYINGAIGGLMTTHPSIDISDPFTGEKFGEPSFEKADAEGKQLAIIALLAMQKPETIIDSAGIDLVARSIDLPIDNTLFKIGALTGIIDRSTVGWMKTRSEAAVFSIGPLTFATLPGEAYPELVNGGIEAPKGADFGIAPVEVPSIRDMMPGEYKFIFCLANDEIGYIIPKSQWDVKPPYTYNRKDSPYGEENSMGPETAPLLHGKLKEMLQELKSIN